MEPQLEYKLNIFLLFWRPSKEFKVPEAPQGHSYIPLAQGYFTAKYDKNLMAYPMIAESLNTPAFDSVINSANYVIKSPWIK